MKQIEILIAGQGAAAYAAALYAARYRIETVVVGESFGGETATGGTIENYPGAPNIDGLDLMLKFKQQVQELDVPIVDSNLKTVRIAADRFICELDSGDRYSALTVVLAIGRERRVLGLEHELEWTGRGISYCTTCDAPLYRGKRTAAVVGGGNAAVEGAILLAKYAKQVFLIYRGKQLFRPEPVLLKALAQAPNVTVLYETEIAELLGNQSGLTAVRLTKPHAGQAVLELDGLFVEAGADPRTTVPKQLGVELNSQSGEVHVDRSQATNIAGIYAAGDLTDGATLKQTVTAASQGATAALSAYQRVIEHRTRQG